MCLWESEAADKTADWPSSSGRLRTEDAQIFDDHEPHIELHILLTPELGMQTISSWGK